jgi:hypothetical protein
MNGIFIGFPLSNNSIIRALTNVSVRWQTVRQKNSRLIVLSPCSAHHALLLARTRSVRCAWPLPNGPMSPIMVAVSRLLFSPVLRSALLTRKRAELAEQEEAAVRVVLPAALPVVQLA